LALVGFKDFGEEKIERRAQKGTPFEKLLAKAKAAGDICAGGFCGLG